MFKIGVSHRLLESYRPAGHHSSPLNAFPCVVTERSSCCIMGRVTESCHRTPLILHAGKETRPHLKGIIVTYQNMFCCRFTSPSL
jgi:hypothetical protein